MRPPDTIVVDGHAFSWRRLLELRRRQLEKWRNARPEQPALFQMRDDARPKSERKAAGRLKEPTLMAWLDGAAALRSTERCEEFCGGTGRSRRAVLWPRSARRDLSTEILQRCKGVAPFEALGRAAGEGIERLAMERPQLG